MGGAKDPVKQVGVARSEMTCVSGEIAKQTIIIRTINVETQTYDALVTEPPPLGTSPDVPPS